MRLPFIAKNIGILLATFSLAFIPPIFVAMWYNEGTLFVFTLAVLIVLSIGTILWYPYRYTQLEPRVKDGFLIVFIFWIILSIVGALPFLLTPRPEMSFVDSLFESISGFTATGATVLNGLDTLPRSLLFYRQELQFLGGMGIILLAVAILPTLGVGGMQLFQAEFPGPAKDAKLTPRIAHTAKALWMIYVGLTIFCGISYWAAGMELFDAIGYAFSTVSTGGFATHDQSIGYFHSQMIQTIAIVFMILGGTNFTLHFIAINNGSLRTYFRDLEFKTFIGIIIVATVAIFFVLKSFAIFKNGDELLVQSLFHVVSLLTTTGLTSHDYQFWPLFIPILLLLLGIIGGCSGSTSGGIKIVRALLLFKQGNREIKRLIHPNAFFVIKFGNHALSDRIINAIWGYLATYMALFGIFLILILATGLDFTTAYSSVAATLSNIGPGLGLVADDYKSINDVAKLILSFSMLVGRLELFTVLVLLSPTYWKA